jgi:hypothetical protein
LKVVDSSFLVEGLFNKKELFEHDPLVTLDLAIYETGRCELGVGLLPPPPRAVLRDAMLSGDVHWEASAISLAVHRLAM